MGVVKVRPVRTYGGEEIKGFGFRFSYHGPRGSLNLLCGHLSSTEMCNWGRYAQK